MQGDCTDMFDEYFNEDNPVETRTIDDVYPKAAQTGIKTCCSAEQDKGIEISLSVPSLAPVVDQKKALPLNDWEIPRNESSDSALGDSESEDAGQEPHRHESDGPFYGDEQNDWQDELEVPLPG